MATGTRLPIVLPADLQASLEALRSSRVAPARDKRNARLLLWRATGVSYRQCARRVPCSTATVYRVCACFCTGGWDALVRERPRGRPRPYPVQRREQLLAWATADPQACGLPCSRWSLAALQRLWQRTFPEPAPARETLRRWLHAAGIPWYRIRSWCTSNDPRYAEKTAAVCQLYLHPPADTAVLCYDQKPHLQALSRRVDNRPPQTGKPGRQEHDYQRHGTLCLHALLDTQTGRTLFACRPDHRSPTIGTLLGRWAAERHEPRIALVMDNLNANHAEPVRGALAASGKQVSVCATATYSSWQNQVERVFADLERELLQHARAASVGDLEYQIAAWFGERNARAQPYHWTFDPASVMDAPGH